MINSRYHNASFHPGINSPVHVVVPASSDIPVPSSQAFMSPRIRKSRDVFDNIVFVGPYKLGDNLGGDRRLAIDLGLVTK